MARTAVLAALVAAAFALAAAQDATVSVAHRGYWTNSDTGQTIENTLTAVRAADELGSEGFEIDMRMTADGVLILMHDATLDRTTNCSGAVTNLNYHGYIEYCVAGRIEPVPTVPDLLDYMITSTSFAYFDIKCTGTCIDVLATVLESYAHNFTERLYLGANSQADVARIAQLLPDYKRSIVMSVLPSDPDDVDVENFNMNFSPIQNDPTFVARANANNQTVFAWTINSESGMAEALSIPVNGVVTDYPDVFMALRDGRRAK